MFDEEVASMNFTLGILEKESEIDALWILTTCSWVVYNGKAMFACLCVDIVCLQRDRHD